MRVAGGARAADRHPAGLRLAALPGRRHRPGERAGLRLADAGRRWRSARSASTPSLVAAAARHDLHAPSPCRPASASRPRLQAGVGAALVRRFVRQPLTLTLPARRRPASWPPAGAAQPGRRRAWRRWLLRAAGVVPAARWRCHLGQPGGSATSPGVLIAHADRPDADRPAALGVGAAPHPGRPDAGRWSPPSSRLGDRPGGRWNDERRARVVQPRRLERLADPGDPAAGAAAGAGGAARRVQRQPRSRAAREMRAATEHWLGGGARAGDGLERAGAARRTSPPSRPRARAEGNPAIASSTARRRSLGATAIDRLAPKPGRSGDVIAIRQIEPIDGNATALGVNAMSVPAARAAILTAIEHRPAGGDRRLSPDPAERATTGRWASSSTRRSTTARSAPRPSGARAVARRRLRHAGDGRAARRAGRQGAGLPRACASSTPTRLAHAPAVAGRAGCDDARRRPAATSGRCAFAGRQWDLRASAHGRSDVPDARDRSALAVRRRPACSRRRCSAPRC